MTYTACFETTPIAFSLTSHNYRIIKTFCTKFSLKLDRELFYQPSYLSSGNDPSIPAESRYKLTEFQEETEVLMGDLTREIIEAYVDTGEPM